MPQSLSNVLIHLVFSTKNRVNLITSEIEKELYAYIVSISKTHKCPSLEIGGTENHLHILFRLERTVTISHIVERIKTGSSKWIKTTGISFKDFGQIFTDLTGKKVGHFGAGPGIGKMVLPFEFVNMAHCKRNLPCFPFPIFFIKFSNQPFISFIATLWHQLHID